MLATFIDNPEVFGVIMTLILTLIGFVFKKKLSKQRINALAIAIYDIIQDLRFKEMPNEAKRRLALEQIDKNFNKKDKSLLSKVFGSAGGALEYVYKNREWLLTAGSLARRLI